MIDFVKLFFKWDCGLDFQPLMFGPIGLSTLSAKYGLGPKCLNTSDLAVVARSGFNKNTTVVC